MTEAERELWRRYRRDVQDMRIMDDVFMQSFFQGQKRFVEEVVRTIMDNDELTVVRMSTQFKIASLHGHSTILDVRAVDAAGRVYDIEIQRAESGAGSKRARYYSALLDASALKAGEDYEALPETYVIFITEEDVFGRDRPIYDFSRCDQDCDLKLNDGAHILYVNGAKRTKGTRLGTMLHDFFCTDPDEMANREFARRARELKQNTEGGMAMCRILERVKARGIAEGEARGEARGLAKGRAEGEAKGRAEGEAKGRAEGEARGLAKGEKRLRSTVEKLILAGKMTLSEIAEVSGLALREVRKLNAGLKKAAVL